MTFTGEDLGRIRGSIALLVIVAAAGAGAVYWTSQQLQAERNATTTMEAKVAEARSRVSRVQLEKQELALHYPEYQALISRGVVGQDRRLEWIETVESLGRKHGLFSLNYTLGGQTLFQDPAADEVRASFDAFESPLTLEMAVLHEEQLLAFLRELRSQIHGLTILERCSVERVGSGRELRFGPQLKATCAIRLINLREKKKGA